MSPAHPELAAGRWWELSLVEQLAIVGSEVERALDWASENNPGYSRRALERGRELLDLTIADSLPLHRLKELTRTRETLLDYFLGDNGLGSTEAAWRRYFAACGLAAALRKERSREQ
jgi:hypothetical protein